MLRYVTNAARIIFYNSIVVNSFITLCGSVYGGVLYTMLQQYAVWYVGNNVTILFQQFVANFLEVAVELLYTLPLFFCFLETKDTYRL